MMTITTAQNKAPQTVAARGDADNPLWAGLSKLISVVKSGSIVTPFNDGVSELIAKNYRKLQFNSQKQPNHLGWMGYNGGSLKTRQHPTAESWFFCTPITAACLRTRAGGRLTSLGVLGIGNDPADLVGESTPTLTRWFSISKQGGYHA